MLLNVFPKKGLVLSDVKIVFFNGGRSYLEPLEENTPHIPSAEEAKGKIVRLNDGNDSNVQRELVEEIAQHYDNYFFNTSIPKNLEGFSGPVVLTLNPDEMTDKSFYKLDKIPNNLMFVRIRVNSWNTEVVEEAINYYVGRNVMCVLTFMAYYETPIPEHNKCFYEWKQRTTNSYWCIKQEFIDNFMKKYIRNLYVDCCTKKGEYSCRFCGNCLREFYACKERMQLDK